MSRTNASLLCAALSLLLAPRPAAAQAPFPRIGNLWGYGPGTRDTTRLSRYSVLVMGGGTPAEFRAFRAAMKQRSSHVRILGTAPFTNIGPPRDTPWMQDGWFLRRPDGSKVAWWADQIYVPNLTVDACLDALVEQSRSTYGALLADGTLDGLFFDSVVGAATWLGDVDADGDGKADAPARIDPAWQARQNVFFDRLREMWPRCLVLANDVDPGHAAHLNGRLYEGGPLLDRVAEGTLPAADAVATIDKWVRTARQPGITFAIMTHPVGWQGWRVGRGSQVTTRGETERARRDFRRMRLGLLTTLMTDASYAYDLGTVWYGLPWWYAEYDAPLGSALGPYREVADPAPYTVLDWKAGDTAAPFRADAAARHTRQGMEAGVTDAASAWNRVLSTDPRRVRFEPGKTYRIDARCRILRRPTNVFQLQLRTTRGGWERHDKGVTTHSGDASGVWTIRLTVVPDAFDDYSLEWHLLGAGALRLERLTVRRVGDSYLRRDFQGGIALLNPLDRPITVPLGARFSRLKDGAAPRWVLEVDDSDAGFRARGAWERRGGEDRYVGPGYRLASKPGATAAWSFRPPATGAYSVMVTAPGGKHLTSSAEYTLIGGQPAATVKPQRDADGGWMPLFTARLEKGRSYALRVRSSGTGATAADAVRLESAARWNDGASVTRVALPPRDGVVLLRERAAPGTDRG